MEGLNSGPPKTNPSSGREEDLNPGPPDFKSSALPLSHARLTNKYQIPKEKYPEPYVRDRQIMVKKKLKNTISVFDCFFAFS